MEQVLGQRPLKESFLTVSNSVGQDRQELHEPYVDPRQAVDQLLQYEIKALKALL